MTTKTKAIIATPPFRMSYAHLITPRPYMEGGKPKGAPTYNVEMLVPDDDMGKFKLLTDDGWQETDLAALLVQMARDEWGQDFSVKDNVKFGGMKWPLMNGTKKADEGVEEKKDKEAYRGMTAIRIKSHEKFPPSLTIVRGGKLVTLDRNDDEDLALAKKLFASGSYAQANINIVPHDVDGKKYLTFYCNTIRMYKEGPKLGGMSDADRFDGIEGGTTDYDPTGGSTDLDDEIPF
jgi:hypothetical protein